MRTKLWVWRKAEQNSNDQWIVFPHAVLRYKPGNRCFTSCFIQLTAKSHTEGRGRVWRSRAFQFPQPPVYWRDNGMSKIFLSPPFWLGDAQRATPKIDVLRLGFLERSRPRAAKESEQVESLRTGLSRAASCANQVLGSADSIPVLRRSSSFSRPHRPGYRTATICSSSEHDYGWLAGSFMLPLAMYGPSPS